MNALKKLLFWVTAQNNYQAHGVELDEEEEMEFKKNKEVKNREEREEEEDYQLYHPNW